MTDKKNREKLQTTLGALVMALIFLLVGAFCGLLIIQYLDRRSSSSQSGDLLLFAVMIAGLYLTMYIQIVLHEAGHLVCGLLSGYRFLSFRVGGLILQKTDGSFGFRRMRLAGTGGQCLMIPPEQRPDGTVPFVLYNLGGVLMNVLTAAVFWLLSLLWPGSAAALVLRMGALVGLAFALVNGLPLHMKEIDNDGCNIVSMRRDPEAVRAFWAQLSANARSAAGVRLRDMPEAWFALPPEANLGNTLISSVAVLRENRLCDEGKLEEADAAAQALLEGSARLPGLYRSLLINDRIFFALLRGEDPAPMLTKQQRSFMKRMQTYPSILRTEYALARHAGDEARAAATLRRFSQAAQRYPNPADIAAERELLSRAGAPAL